MTSICYRKLSTATNLLVSGLPDTSSTPETSCDFLTSFHLLRQDFRTLDNPEWTSA